MKVEPIRLERLTLDDALEAAEKRGIVIVPAATTEGHGFHLPLGTDTFVAEWIAERLSEKTGIPALLPTPIRCGCSPTFHFDTKGDPLTGTLAIGHETMARLFLDLCRGLWAAGFRKIVVVQAHGQEWNFQVLAHETATLLRREGKGLFIAAATYWELAAQEIRNRVTTPFWHAGEWETSAMLTVDDTMVRLDEAKGSVRVPLIDADLIKGSVVQDEREAFAVQDVASWVNIPEPGEIHDSGVGPTEAIQSATAEKGRAVLDRAVERYLDLIRDLETHYAPREVPGIDVTQRPDAPRFTVDY